MPLRREFCVSAQMRTKSTCASFCRPYAEYRPNTRFVACSARDSPQSLRCRGGTCSPQWVPPPFVKRRRSRVARAVESSSTTAWGRLFPYHAAQRMPRPSSCSLRSTHDHPLRRHPVLGACVQASVAPLDVRSRWATWAQRLRRGLRCGTGLPPCPRRHSCRPRRPTPSIGAPRPRRVGGAASGSSPPTSRCSARSRRTRHPARSPISS